MDEGKEILKRDNKTSFLKVSEARITSNSIYMHIKGKGLYHMHFLKYFKMLKEIF